MVREYGLIGRNIAHSFSADFFNRKFADENIEASYSLFDLPAVADLLPLIEAHPHLAGLNVTSPYKREVIPFLHSLSTEARELQAVNVIEISRKTGGGIVLRGHNTDCRGFSATLEGLTSPGCRALVLGTGGASSAVCFALRMHNIPFKVVSRTPENEEISYRQANTLLAGYPLVINATPVGMHPRSELSPAIDYTQFTPRHIAYDLIYNPAQTEFLKKAGERGAKTVNGMDMLLNQALLSWKIWNKTP